jgi:hypothetical protein
MPAAVAAAEAVAAFSLFFLPAPDFLSVVAEVGVGASDAPALDSLTPKEVERGVGAAAGVDAPEGVWASGCETDS